MVFFTYTPVVPGIYLPRAWSLTPVRGFCCSYARCWKPLCVKRSEVRTDDAFDSSHLAKRRVWTQRPGPDHVPCCPFPTSAQMLTDTISEAGTGGSCDGTYIAATTPLIEGCIDGDGSVDREGHFCRDWPRMRSR